MQLHHILLGNAVVRFESPTHCRCLIFRLSNAQGFTEVKNNLRRPTPSFKP